MILTVQIQKSRYDSNILVACSSKNLCLSSILYIELQDRTTENSMPMDIWHHTGMPVAFVAEISYKSIISSTEKENN